MTHPSPSTEVAEPAAPDERRASTLELFFDLVFVFAFTQVTGLLAANPTPHGLLSAVLLLMVLWWSWGAYAWLTNAVNTDFLLPRLVLLGCMGALAVVSLTAPEAFGDAAVPFAVGNLLVMVLHTLLFATAGGKLNRAAIRWLSPTNMIGSLLILAAAFLPDAWRGWIWLAAVAVLYAGPFITGVDRFSVHPGHFSERHQLIVIIAFGESIVAVGVGATAEGGVSGLELATGLVAIALVSAMWWRYFDSEAKDGEHALVHAQGVARPRLARDTYSYMHLPLVASIVLMAVGVKKTVGHAESHLKPLPALLLCGGAALFLLMLAAIKLRRRERVPVSTWAGVTACLAVTPVALYGPAIVALGALALIYVTIVIVDMRSKYRTL
ncbi:low temperature requirement protein A [Actinorhabdospora filicis]|uniref:Low temperature requirement protein A n=1 Tax=Actinorhabdospora filicis TaxID=1785913 RepID=A0A9W6WBP1_9ACTN|nr:low temperature requirement protein A [Actinorhabdospora filicis]GLZ78920.1 low temperature requirement protein A [Actinorhabdospora filicis]